MKRIRAERMIDNHVIKEFEQIDKLEEYIQYDLLRVITKEILDHKLIGVKKSNERGDPYGPTRYQIEVFVMSPKEFKEVMELLTIIKSTSVAKTPAAFIRLDRLLLDKLKMDETH